MLLMEENKPHGLQLDFMNYCDDCEYCEGIEDGTYYMNGIKYVSVRCKDDPRYNGKKVCPKEKATGVAYSYG